MEGTSLLDPGYAQAREFGAGTDFKVYTGPMHLNKSLLPEADQDKPIVFMRGSSSIMDLQGDIMTLDALHSMQDVDPKLLLFLNHSYDLPDDIYGQLYSMPKIEIQNNIADLWIGSEAIFDAGKGYPAERTYNLIVRNKLRLGCSVGCLVLDWDFTDEDDPFAPILIKLVKVLEWSVVSIPANQRCWVENAIKGIFARSLLEGNGENALRLAPAVKGLFPRDYASVLDGITNMALQKDMSHVAARSTHPQKIMYSFEGEGGFYLDTRGSKKSLTREETETLLTNDAALRQVTKAVSGNTSLPLMDIGTEWTGSRAEKEIFAQAENDDGTIQASKAKPGFLYYDPDNSNKRGGYKMPFCYSGLKIVPLGVRACANVLNGGMGGVSASAEDKSGMKAKCKTMYGRINSQFKPDPEWVVPWEKKDSSEPEKVLGFDTVLINGVTYAFNEEDNTFLPWVGIAKAAEEVLDTQAGSALNRQDLGEVEEDEVDGKEKGVSVSADGSHDPFSGSHTHAHKAYGAQGDDDLHSHEHAHDGDAHHGHSHAEKSTEAGKQAGGPKVDEDGNHANYTGSHAHAHKAFGASDGNDDGMHSHDHAHQDDSIHRHSHAAKAQKAVATDEDGNHDPFSGTHIHKHKAFGADGADGDGMHGHSHDHENDTNHKHSHAAKSAEPAKHTGGSGQIHTPPEAVHDPFMGTHGHVHAAFDAGDGDAHGNHAHDHLHNNDNIHTHAHGSKSLVPAPEQLTLLSIYNDIGKRLGFPEHSMTTKCDLVATPGDAGIVRSMLSALDGCSDAMIALAQRTDSYVDQLMSMMGVTDTDDGDDDGNAGTTEQPILYSFAGLVTKEGRALNEQNRGLVQAIHDAAYAMHPDVCKGISGDGTAHQSTGTTVQDAQDEASRMGQGQPSEAMILGLQAMEKLATAFESASVASMVEQAVATAVHEAMGQARKSLEALNREQQALMEHLAKLKNMPLGRPTSFTRSVVAQDDRVASYTDLASIRDSAVQKETQGAHGSLAEALMQTSLVELPASPGMQQKAQYRKWPAGVGVEVRPPLTNNQKSMMLIWDIANYRTGEGDAHVPMIDDPAESLAQ